MKKLLVLAALCAGMVSANAASVDNGVSLNGVSLNGINLNGVKLNGLGYNGVKLNGLGYNGVKLNGLGYNGTATDAPSKQSFTSIVLPSGQTLALR